MKAAQISKPGGSFEVVERPIPQPARGQVRIKVEACGICHSDAQVKEGLWPGIQYPRVPGHEIAGRIDAVGPDVTNWNPGQRVGVGWHGGHCFTCEPCRRGDFILCQFGKITGISFDGGYAEYMIAPAEAVAAMPGDLMADEAAPPDSKSISALVDGLAPNGKLVIVGASPEPLTITPLQLIGARRSIQGWPSGSAKDSEDTMQFSTLTGVRPMIERYPLDRAADAYDQMISGRARFRVVLTTGG